MSQTSYAINQAVGRAGLLYDSGFTDKMSKQLNSSGEVGVFGCLVVQDTGDNDVKAPAAATDITGIKNVAGVVIASANVQSNSGSDPAYYPNKYTIPVLRKGRIWVLSEDAVDLTKSVFVRYLAGSAGTQKGAFRATTVSSEATQLPDANAKWLSSTSGANALAILEINLP